MESVRIFGKNYLIDRVDKFEDAGQVGAADSDGIISIKKNTNYDFEQETLLHEIIHCIDEAIGSGLTEQQVTAISSGLFCVYRENDMHIISRPGV